MSVVCCQVEISASIPSLVQRIPTEWGVSECNREASITRRPWPTRACCAMGKQFWPIKNFLISTTYAFSLSISSVGSIAHDIFPDVEFRVNETANVLLLHI